jgi:hypothetical protein
MVSQGKGGERNTRGEDGSGVTGPGTESGDCRGEGCRVRGNGDFGVGKEKVDWRRREPNLEMGY